MTAKEADIAVLQKTIRIRVKADGQAITDIVTKVKILNETGRIGWGTLRFNYAPKNVRFKVIRAETQNEGGVFKVDKTDIVDTQIFATENGFDESRQIVISFPQVQVGSILTFETKEEIFKPFIDNHFASRFYFGYYDLDEQSDIDITSRRQLFLEISDPDNKLDVKRAEKDGDYQYRIHLKEPLIRRVVDEVRLIVEEKRYTSLTVSTAQTYPAMFGELAGRYENILKQPLPDKFKPLVEKARGEKTPIAQINSVLANLADMIRYMGDWRSVDGGFIPRTMQQVADTRFGDCKDMSMVTARILRELGMESSVALTIRGVPPREISQIPYLEFNHAIVSVNVDGRQLWVDPTNFQSFADGVFEDIAGRQALLMHPTKMQLKPIEFTEAQKNLETMTTRIHLDSDKIRHDVLQLDLVGSMAQPVTGSELRYSRDQFEEGTIGNLANRADLEKYHFGPWDLKSRIVAPIKLNVEIERRFHPVETSMGLAFEFEAPEDINDLAKVDRANRESSFKLATPYVAKSTTVLENVTIQGDAVKNCIAKSPWIDYEFTVSKRPVQVVRNMVVKRYLITRDEVRSPEFAKFQEIIRGCARAKYLIFKRVPHHP
jgi:hypothetical protein